MSLKRKRLSIDCTKTEKWDRRRFFVPRSRFKKFLNDLDIDEGSIVDVIDNEVEDANLAKGRGEPFLRRFRSPFDLLSSVEVEIIIKLCQ